MTKSFTKDKIESWWTAADVAWAFEVTIQAVSIWTRTRDLSPIVNVGGIFRLYDPEQVRTWAKNAGRKVINNRPRKRRLGK